MSDYQWNQVKDVFQAALEKSLGAEREKFLNEIIDTDVRGEVLALLVSFAEANDFLDAPPIGAVAAELVGAGESLIAGQQIGRYRIEKKLGAGGMGEVYLARDTELERLVALKILSAAFSDNPDRIRRFVQEAKAASALNHPNILTIYEIGKLEDVRFIATEFIAGETLRERMRREPLNLDEIADVFGQTAAALEAAHRAGIVHRDIKPENIMLREDNLVKVLDFGLAKLVETVSAVISGERKPSQINTTPGLVIGTVAYMSPEQARGLQTDARSDVWSVGVCLYETVFGAQPFAGDTASDQIAAILKSEVDFVGDSAPPELRQIIEKCLEKNIADRYQTIKDFSFDLKNLNQKTQFNAERGFSFAASATQQRRANGGATDERGAFPTRNGSDAPLASSAEYVVGEIKKHKFLSFGAFGAIAAVLLAAILYFPVFNRVTPADSPPKTIHSLAVMSFINENGNSDGEYLCDGLSESLINKLSELPQLKVAARSSAFKFKGREITPREAARALNVEAIVTGSVKRRGDDLQISVELVNGADDSLVWSETYRRKIADAQTIQDEIARTVVQKLRLKLSGAQTERISQPLTTNPEAYQLYLNGVFFRRKNGTENWQKAVEYQKQAVALDPNFALAFTELATDYYNFVGIGDAPTLTGLPPAREAIEKALALDDTLAEAHNVNGMIKIAEFDWNGAEREFRRALESNRSLAQAHTNYSELLSNTGRFDEALSEIRRARELDPLRINLVNYEAAIFINARRYDEARTTFDRAAPEAANETFALIDRARLAAFGGRYAEGVVLLEKSLSQDTTTSATIHLGWVNALAGDRARAAAQIDRLKMIPYYASPAELSIFHAASGDRDRAFAELEKAFAARDYRLGQLKTNPEYDSLRDDPRFADLLRRLAFPD